MVIRQLSETVIRQPPDSQHAAIRQSLDSHQTVIGESIGSHLQERHQRPLALIKLPHMYFKIPAI